MRIPQIKNILMTNLNFWNMTQSWKQNPRNIEYVQVWGYSHYLDLVSILNMPLLHSYKVVQLFHLESVMTTYCIALS